MMLSKLYNLCSRIIIFSFHISNAFEQEEQLLNYKLMYFGVTLTGPVVKIGHFDVVKYLKTNTMESHPKHTIKYTKS